MPLYQVIFLEVPTLTIILWVASRIYLLERRLRNVEKQLEKGGSVSLVLDPNALKELGGKLAEEEKQQDIEKAKQKEEAEKESASQQKTEEK